MVTIAFNKSNELAKTPTRGSDFAAGYDLYSTEEYTLKPLERHLFKTGLSIAIPTGLYGRIAPRSGLAYKDGLDVMAGVIDEDYRGDVGVILINLGSVDKKIAVGDKIAQIIFENYTVATFVDTNDLSKTLRGVGGFGSTDPVKESTVEGTLAAFKTIVENMPSPMGTHQPTGSGEVPIKVPTLTSAVKVPGVTQGKSLAELYLQDGGIPIKKRYIDEIKERDNQ